MVRNGRICTGSESPQSSCRTDERRRRPQQDQQDAAPYLVSAPFYEKEKPDVVVAFTRGVLYRALAAGIGTGIPVVISVRTDPVGHYDKKADKLRIPLLFPHAAGCVFQTEGAKAFFAPYLQENSRIILNPLNPKYVGVPEPAVRTKDVVQSGRLVDFKNQPMLIRAFLKVHEKHPDYTLKIYGPDSKDGTKEILESIIHEIMRRIL